MKFTVPCRSLRRAVNAVLPHTAPPKSDDVMLQYLQLQVEGSDLLVSSTDRHRAAVASVPIDDHIDGEAGRVHLHAPDAQQLVRMFPAPNKDQGDGQLLLEVVGDYLRVQDVGGLWPGKSARWPAQEREDFPDAEGFVGARFRVSQSAVGSTAATPLYLGRDDLTAMGASARALDLPGLIRRVDAAQPGVLVTIGDDFALTIPAMRAGETSHADLTAGWMHLLPDGPRYWPDDEPGEPAGESTVSDVFRDVEVSTEDGATVVQLSARPPKNRQED